MTTVWPEGRAPGGPLRGFGPLVIDGYQRDGREEIIAEPGTYPVPPGRGRWRLALHRRVFSATTLENSLITEIIDARSRRLDQTFNSPAKLIFTLDGRHPSAKLIQELTTDVTAWRWDDQVGRDRLMFRGVVAQTEDVVTEQAYSVNFTCHDYVAMMGRRFLTTPVPLNLLSQNQDAMVGWFLSQASGVASSSGHNFMPGSYLPLQVATVDPNGGPRPSGGGGPPAQILRDRTYLGGQNLGEALDNLSQVINGFDYDCLPSETGVDRLRIFYPYQGERRDIPLAYGSSVSGFTRSVNSGDYANYWRVLGNNNAGPDDDPTQIYGEAWNADSNDVGRIPIGLWMGAEAAADVSDINTLTQKAQGDVQYAGQITANWSLTLRPGAYAYGTPNMGDTVTLMVRTGRLDTAGDIRVIGLAYLIGDDGQEDVQVTVGRPRTTLGQFLTQSDSAVDALTRRSDQGLAPSGPRGFVAEARNTVAVSVGNAFTNALTLSAPLYSGRRYRVSAYAWGAATWPTGSGMAAIRMGQGVLGPTRQMHFSMVPNVSGTVQIPGNAMSTVVPTANGNYPFTIEAEALTSMLFNIGTLHLLVEDIGGT
jgi:hypothetical protein